MVVWKEEGRKRKKKSHVCCIVRAMPWADWRCGSILQVRATPHFEAIPFFPLQLRSSLDGREKWTFAEIECFACPVTRQVCSSASEQCQSANVSVNSLLELLSSLMAPIDLMLSGSVVNEAFCITNLGHGRK